MISAEENMMVVALMKMESYTSTLNVRTGRVLL